MKFLCTFMELKCVTSVTCNFTVRHISAILILIYANCNVLPFYDLCKLSEYCINRAEGGCPQHNWEPAIWFSKQNAFWSTFGG